VKPNANYVKVREKVLAQIAMVIVLMNVQLVMDLVKEVVEIVQEVGLHMTMIM
jgi:hypothetical protein